MFGIGSIIKALVALIIVGVIAGAGWYITGLRADLAVREANEQRLKEGIEEQQRVMQRMQADMQSIQRANAALNDTIKRQADDVMALTKKFNQDRNGNARDFGEFAATKPDLVERLINRGTVNAYRCIEIASGSALTAQEIAATSRDTINRECPALANPNYRAGVDVAAMARVQTPNEGTKPESKQEDKSTPPVVSPSPVTKAPPPPLRPPPPPGAKK